MPQDEFIGRVLRCLDRLYDHRWNPDELIEPFMANKRLCICAKCWNREGTACGRLGDDPTGMRLATFLSRHDSVCELWGAEHQRG